LVKTEQGGKVAIREDNVLFEETKEEKDVRVLKGLFTSIKTTKAGIFDF